MPPSQLKRLKASLREQGVVGPQKSKKQKKQIAQNGGNKDKRVSRTTALAGIREQFNPFEVKVSARGPKFDVTSNKTMGGRVTKSVKNRPGVTKGLGEENRRKTLLVEMHRRNKVGGIMDKRFGENDPSMAPEDKMLERFTQEKTRQHKTNSTFDLEDDEDQEGLTHMGQSLSLDGPDIHDDFDEEGLVLSDAEDHPSDDGRKPKRRRSSDSEGTDDDEVEEEGLPGRKKTKQEVMKEVMAKSKLYKYERQTAKDDDEDLREELDKDLPNIHALLRGIGPRAPPKLDGFAGMNPDRAALLTGQDKVNFDKEYDKRLRQLAQDEKAKPTERSKTEDEKAAEDSRKLQDLEKRRLRRMEGLAEEEDVDKRKKDTEEAVEVEDDDIEDFGLGAGIKAHVRREDLGVEDEDDFIIDDGLVASEVDEESSEDENEEDGSQDEAEDDEFLAGLLTEDEAKRPEFLTGANAPLQDLDLPSTNGINGNLAYTFPCPESHVELLEITKSISVLDLPVVVQRIRALYHPKLKSENKLKLANFTLALIDHVSHLTDLPKPPPFSVVETLIRHIHSLAKSYPVETANYFRKQLEIIQASRPLSLIAGDLMILTAIGSIFPTSDHFHQAVTPAMLTMGRYLGQKIPRTLSDHATGLYVATLMLQYQSFSKRYVPELIGVVLNTLCALAPKKLPKNPDNFAFAYHEPKTDLRFAHASGIITRPLNFHDTKHLEISEQQEIELKGALVVTGINVLAAAADIWIGKASFYEVFDPALSVLGHLGSKRCFSDLPKAIQTILLKVTQKIKLLRTQSTHDRRPLLLHNHKPLAIKTSIPKFEESFNPDKHYDPDRERSDASKLKAEFKREKKGAMRELRKDANFIARESLKEKKEKDAAYEKKYKRLIAEIQGEEGQESKKYDREKEWRTKGRKD